MQYIVHQARPHVKFPLLLLIYCHFHCMLQLHADVKRAWQAAPALQPEMCIVCCLRHRPPLSQNLSCPETSVATTTGDSLFCLLLFADCTQVTMNGVGDSLAGLTALNIASCAISDLSHLSCMSALQQLSLRNCSCITEDALPALHSLTGLTSLDLSVARTATPDGLRKLVQAIPRLCVSHGRASDLHFLNRFGYELCAISPFLYID